MKFRFIEDLSNVDQTAWNSLRRCHYPFISIEFLQALEKSKSVGADTGWRPLHILGEEDGDLRLAMPLYLKEHSYGEYVFDWQWARAYEQHGLHYFPKLLSAIPFTPAEGPRLLYHSDIDAEIITQLLQNLIGFAKENALSSWHLLFPDSPLGTRLSNMESLVKREDVQFHWHNQGYVDFGDFLSGFRSNKRKQINRERRKIADQGIKLVRKSGSELSDADWQNFYRCYKATYLKRSGHTGYLNSDFFRRIARTLSEQIMIVLASVEDEVIASSLFFFDESTLYGRYWGALKEMDCLHFEACYYQGIEFAIEKKLQCFNPGTQGEHKLVRGFKPVKTTSFHWIAHPQFASAIEDHLHQERRAIDAYQKSAADYLPFRKDPG